MYQMSSTEHNTVSVIGSSLLNNIFDLFIARLFRATTIHVPVQTVCIEKLFHHHKPVSCNRDGSAVTVQKISQNQEFNDT